MRTLILLVALIPSLSFAGWFGPSNFDDCVLDGIKSAKSDEAAKYVYVACGKKFPEKPQSRVSYETKSGWSIEPWSSRLNERDKNAIWTSFGKIDHRDMSVKTEYVGEKYTELTITNRNSFGIDGVKIGILNKTWKKNYCSRSVDDYSMFFDFNGIVNSMSTATLKNTDPALVRNKSSYCVIGLGIYETKSEANRILREIGVSSVTF